MWFNLEFGWVSVGLYDEVIKLEEEEDGGLSSYAKKKLSWEEGILVFWKKKWILKYFLKEPPHPHHPHQYLVSS